MSQSAIAWFEDVDIALKKEISESVRYMKGNSSILLPEKNILIRKPEEDYKIEVYPCVSIYNLSSDLNTRDYYPYARVDKQTVPSETEEEADKVSYKGENIPFILKYQLDFWARYQRDMNEMLRSWVAGHIRQFNLPIASDEGFSCNCVQEGRIAKADNLVGADRFYHSVISYAIWVEIEDERVYTKFKVEGVTLETRNL